MLFPFELIERRFLWLTVPRVSEAAQGRSELSQ